MRKRSFKSLLAGLVFFLPLVFAQTTQPTPQSTAPPPAASPQQSPAAPSSTPQPQEPAQPPQAAQPQPSATPSHRLEVEPVEKDHQITPAEAKELFRSFDAVLHVASTARGLRSSQAL